MCTVSFTFANIASLLGGSSFTRWALKDWTRKYGTSLSSGLSGHFISPLRIPDNAYLFRTCFIKALNCPAWWGDNVMAALFAVIVRIVPRIYLFITRAAFLCHVRSPYQFFVSMHRSIFLLYHIFPISENFVEGSIPQFQFCVYFRRSLISTVIFEKHASMV